MPAHAHETASVFLCPNHNSVSKAKTSATEVCWKCFFWASPSHKPQQLSSTALGMCRKGSSQTAAEVRSTLRCGWQHQHRPADSNVDIKKNKSMRTRNELISFFPTEWPDPLTQRSAPLVSLVIWNVSKLGQPNCLSVCSIYFTMTSGWVPNLYPIHCNLESLICVLLCNRQELHKGH